MFTIVRLLLIFININMKIKLLTTLLLILASILFIKLLGDAIDRSIDNQNLMLCKSAKISQNSEYLLKCQQYYSTGNILYMREQ